MRVGWMRPSETSRVSATLPICRRTGSKADSVTASGVSSMITSQPVASSSARMLRPSRPMMRPFISSLGIATTDTVDSVVTSDATRCTAVATNFRARSDASSLIVASASRTRRFTSSRISPSISPISLSRASSDVSCATASSRSRSCDTRCSISSWRVSSSWCRDRSRCSCRSMSPLLRSSDSSRAPRRSSWRCWSCRARRRSASASRRSASAARRAASASSCAAISRDLASCSARSVIRSASRRASSRGSGPPPRRSRMMAPSMVFPQFDGRRRVPWCARCVITVE